VDVVESWKERKVVMLFDDFDVEVSPEETVAYQEHLDMVEYLEGEEAMAEEITAGLMDDLEALLYGYEDVITRKEKL
jgi:hypothetical protein